jgi:hypothetical protein
MIKRVLTLVSAIRVISCILIRGDDNDVHLDHDAWLESLASASRRAFVAIGTRAMHRHLSSAQVNRLKTEVGCSLMPEMVFSLMSREAMR